MGVSSDKKESVCSRAMKQEGAGSSLRFDCEQRDIGIKVRTVHMCFGGQVRWQRVPG